MDGIFITKSFYINQSPNPLNKLFGKVASLLELARQQVGISGVQEKSSYTEQDMESAIIGKLQQFLLEPGKGFLFKARQRRCTFDKEHFFVDLVFYNRLLQCYVLVDLKTDKLSHQDLGQMQVYVNYYDRFVKLPHEKPTIGMLLCKKKTDSLVQLTLPKEANIYAAAYSLYLPGKQLLQQKWKNGQ